MNLRQSYPNSYQMILSSGILSEENLSDVKKYLIENVSVSPSEKGKLTRLENQGDVEGFYSHVEQILSNFTSEFQSSSDNQFKSTLTHSTSVINQPQPSNFISSGNETQVQGASAFRNQQPEAVTTSLDGDIFEEDFDRIFPTFQKNSSVFLWLILVIISSWQLLNKGEESYVAFSLAMTISILVPLIMSEIFGRTIVEEFLIVFSGFGFLGILMYSLVDIELNPSTNLARAFFVSELENQIILIMYFLSIIAFTQSWSKRKDSIPFIGNPWSLPLVVIASMNFIFIFVESLSPISIIEMNFAMISYGAAMALIQGRGTSITASIVMLIVVKLLIAADETTSNFEFMIFLVLPLLTWFLTYILIDYRIKSIRPQLTVIVIFFHGMINVTKASSSESVITQIFIWLIFIVLVEAYYRVSHPPEHEVLKILDPREGNTAKGVELQRKIAIIGSPASGKSCYLGSLWTLLKDPIPRDLWYGTAKYLSEDHRHPPFSTKDIAELLGLEGSNGFVDEKDLIRLFREHRSVEFTMEDEIKKGIIPDQNGIFPFLVTAKPETRRFLDAFMEQIGKNDRDARRVLRPTTEVEIDLSFNLEFFAEVRSKSSILFGNYSKVKHLTAKVSTTFRTLDLPGEDFRATLDRIEGLPITSSSLDNMIRKLEKNGSKFGKHVEYIVKLIGKSDDVLLLVDADTFTHGVDHSTRNEVIAMLQIAENLGKLDGSSIRHVSCLLNKADHLIHRGEERSRMMPGGALEDWSKISDRQHAFETLIENIGQVQAAHLHNISIDAYYCCTLGGILVDEQEKQYPPYPMVPIHVLEPFLRCLLPRDIQQS